MYRFITDEEALEQINQFRATNTEAPGIRPVVPAEAAPAEAAQNPYQLTDIDLAPRCPHCAKELEEGAVVCLHCGYNTQTRTHIHILRTYAPTAQDVIMWRMPGIICGLVSLAIIAVIVFLWVGLHGWAEDNKDAWWTFIDGLWFQAWGSVFGGVAAFYTGLFAVKRLILHPNPPEIEKH
jgi:hypothetical protein